MVLLEATVVNVALPAIGRDLGAGVAGLQWTLNGYVLTLAALVLAAGSLSDLFGRRRMFILGVAAFVAASALCAAAPTIQLLVAARFVQGVGGALLTPGSLAILGAIFVPDDRTRAIGAWAGLTAVAAAVGPPVGGYLTDALSWRAVFLINLPLGRSSSPPRLPGWQSPGTPPGLAALTCPVLRLPRWPSPLCVRPGSGPRGLAPGGDPRRGGQPARRRRLCRRGAAQRPPDAPAGNVPLPPVRQRHRARAGDLRGARRRD